MKHTSRRKIHDILDIVHVLLVRLRFWRQNFIELVYGMGLLHVSERGRICR